MLVIVVTFLCCRNLTKNVGYSKIVKNRELQRMKGMSDKKKKCFVVTPIGDDNSEIRRHIDGIIDQAIIPAIGEKYEISVSHRDFEIGSINDRIVNRVYESDLVIANLTNTNPNVMYELAIRYSSGKPAIVIAEKGTKLPFDVIDENTIFYVNDPSGANELKEKICETEKKIDLAKKDYGPICKAINKIPLYNEVESGAVTGEDVPSGKMMQYIINRLDNIEQNINYGNRIDTADVDHRAYTMFFDIDNDFDIQPMINQLNKNLERYDGLKKEIRYRKLESSVDITVMVEGPQYEVNRAIRMIKEWEVTNRKGFFKK